MATIRQVIVTGQRRAELQERQLADTLAPDAIRIDTEYTCISAGTELSIYTGAEPLASQPGAWCAYPWPSGYANVGVVSAVGEAVTRVAPGQRVFTFGQHASVITANESALFVPVPAALDPKLAVASRLAGVATTAVALADLGLHPTVVVFGLGMVGNLAAQAFRILGARVIGVEPLVERRALAERCGITQTINGTSDEVHAAVAALTNGRMADIVVDASGVSAVILQALRATTDMGQLILLGSPRTPQTGNLTEVFSEIHLRNITVRGALEWCLPTYPPTGNYGGKTLPAMNLADKQRMIFDWLLDGQMQIAPLISHCLPAAQVAEAYEGLLLHPREFTGVVLDWLHA
jgi:2-desacetyl-2-hydroxyethyl bacteriochlorophyllide A dehydrogenase